MNFIKTTIIGGLVFMVPVVIVVVIVGKAYKIMLRVGEPIGALITAVLAGVLAGLAVLTRGEALFYLPVMLYLVWAKPEKSIATVVGLKAREGL